MSPNWSDGVTQVIEQFQEEDDDFIKSFKLISPFIPQTAQEQNISTIQFGHKVTIEVDIIEEELLFHLYIPTTILSNSKFLLLYKGKQQELHPTNQKDEISIITYITREAIKIFFQMREKFIEQYNDEATPTPGTGIKTTQDFFGEDEIEEVIMDDSEDSSVGTLTSHSILTNGLFGVGTVSVIKDLENLRVRILPDELSNDMKKMYRLWEIQNEPIVLSLQFAPDYTLNPKIPEIQYKPEKEKTGFGEQIQNICRKFLEERWKTMHQISSKSYFDQIFATELSVFREARRDQIEMVKRFVKSKRNHIAMALCVYYCSFNPMEANVLFLESGGNQANTMHESDGKMNIVLELVTYLYLRMIEITTNCCICDRQIMIPFTKMHPTVCTSFKCSFDYVELKICSSIPIVINPITIHNDIVENEDIVDLLISLTYSCAASNRRDVIFDPFPDFYSKSSKNFDTVVKQLDKMPSVAEMKQKKSEKELKEFLGEKYQLLCWILTCCRPAMLRLPEKKRFKEMNTEHQYMMLVDSPEKTSAFNTARKKYGSYFAFHGSSLENWGPILRKGLVNASNTKLMTTGAVYGPGVYMAPDSGTSLGYARVGGNIWKHSKFARFENNLQCLAVCEVVKHPDVPQTPNPYYVVQRTEHITTRYFFFYAGSTVSVMAKDVDFHKFVTDAKK